MRILHTSDWHVGKTLRGRSRADEHRAVLDEITGIARDGKADLILVAGDLFDTAAPSPESEEIVYRALLDLAAVAPVVVISGNHDNPRRLGAVRPLLDRTGIHTATAIRRPEEGGVLELDVAGERARIALFPFLSQRGIVRADDLMSKDAHEHSGDYAERADRILKALCDDPPPDAVNLVLAHAMVHGGAMGGGERSAHTVFEYSVPSHAFPAATHYVALGHLHRAQQIQAACQVHYAGAPLQLDFGDTADAKSVNVIQASAGTPAKVETVGLSAGRPLRRVKGTLERLRERAEAGEFDGAYLQVDLDEPRAPGLADQVREFLPDAVDVRLKAVETEGRPKSAPRVGRSPQELFADYLTEREESNDDIMKLFSDLLEEVQ